MKKTRGRPKKASPVNPFDEKGNPAFNLNEAEALTGIFDETVKPDFSLKDKELAAKPKVEVAQSAITPEMLAFERELQAMHLEQPLPGDEKPVVLQKEYSKSDFLGDDVEGYKPATTLNELDQQVFLAKSKGFNAIEASEEIIKYYTRGSFESVEKEGYFIFKDVKVFIPGRIDGYVNTDKQNVAFKLQGLPG